MFWLRWPPRAEAEAGAKAGAEAAVAEVASGVVDAGSPWGECTLVRQGLGRLPEAEPSQWAEAEGLADDVGGGVASHELALVAALLGLRKLSHGLLMYDTRMMRPLALPWVAPARRALLRAWR